MPVDLVLGGCIQEFSSPMKLISWGKPIKTSLADRSKKELSRVIEAIWRWTVRSCSSSRACMGLRLHLTRELSVQSRDRNKKGHGSNPLKVPVT
jgi:hypothetical protein